jgi:hypothetical protein
MFVIVLRRVLVIVVVVIVKRGFGQVRVAPLEMDSDRLHDGFCAFE